MNFLHQWLRRKNIRILGIGGSLVVGLILLSSATSAQMENLPAKDNSLYEEKPEQVPPVAPTPSSTPLPEKQIKASATINPSDETVDIQLKNQTNVPITYQVIGHTGQEQIEKNQEVMLKDIPLPATVTLVREDQGLLKVIPMSSDTDRLNVILEEDPSFDSVQGSIRIQPDGQVFLN